MSAHILLVEDDIDVAAVTKELLLEEGYEVSWSQDGLQALRFMEEQRLPDLILLDLMMPRMSGTQFLQEFSKLQLPRKIPVLILSAGRNVEIVAMQVGADGFLVKPFDVEKLLETISRHLSSIG